MWLLMKSRKDFPVTSLEGSPTVHPQKKKPLCFLSLLLLVPWGRPLRHTRKSSQENLGTAYAEGLGEGMATHSSILAWKIPWTEETSGLQSTGSQRVGHNWACTHAYTIWINFQGSTVSKWIQSQKHICCLGPFTWLSVKNKTTVMKSRSVVASIQGLGEVRLYRVSMRVFSGVMEGVCIPAHVKCKSVNIHRSVSPRSQFYCILI